MPTLDALGEDAIIAAGTWHDGTGWLAAESLATLTTAASEMFPAERWEQLSLRRETGPLPYVAEFGRVAA